MAGSQSSSSSVKKAGGDNGNGLILYQYYPSYYCQKVVFALNEKKIKYKSRIIDLYQGEQFEPGFIKLNPKSEVPVLQDGVKIIPDSRRIIDYLEDNFSNGGTPRLIPEKGTPQFQMMERMRDMLDNLPIQLVTFGVIQHPHLTGKIRLSQKEIEHKQGVHALHASLLGDLCEKHRDFRDYYLVKKQGLEKVRAAVSDVNEVEKGILDVEYALNTAEKVLAQHTSPEQSGWWLCSEKFTIADISLCVLLHRTHSLGLLDKLFSRQEGEEGSLPHLKRYFARAQQRDSYRRAIGRSPSLLRSFRSLDTKEQVFVTVGGLAVVLAAAGIASFLVQRNK